MFFASHSLRSLHVFFRFTSPSPTAIYTLSLHDALPISTLRFHASAFRHRVRQVSRSSVSLSMRSPAPAASPASRSEEHTSELQSRQHLVCRLLLEKKKQQHKVTPYSLHSHPQIVSFYFS